MCDKQQYAGESKPMAALGGLDLGTMKAGRAAGPRDLEYASPPIVPSIENFLREKAERLRAEAHTLETMARNLPIHMSQEFARALWDTLLKNH
jgi:hypothetical protein